MLSDMYCRQRLSGTHTHTTGVSLDADGGMQYLDACAISYQVILFCLCCSAHPMAKLESIFLGLSIFKGKYFSP